MYQSEANWHNASKHGIELTPPLRRSRLLLWTTVFALGSFFVWAANAPLVEATRGIGKVEPLNRSQVIQSLEGGILKSLLVQEGEEVDVGQTLAIIDDTRFRTAFEDLESQTVALRASLNRLQSELIGADHIEFDPAISEAQDVTRMETDLFRARRQRYTEAVSSLEERIMLIDQELELLRPMVDKGASSKVKQLELEQKQADLKGQLTEMRNSYFQEISDQITKNSAELSSLMQQRAQKLDALARATLRSPVRGIVKNLKITTKGGVVSPGETIMEIVPLDDQLYVEAEIRPQDVAFLHVGQPAKVKITAYDYTIYGVLSGELVFISADTIRDETKRDSEPFYRVRVLTETAALNGPDGPLPIIPGMVSEVSIETGTKTVLEYLIKPILKGQEGFHER